MSQWKKNKTVQNCFAKGYIDPETNLPTSWPKEIKQSDWSAFAIVDGPVLQKKKIKNDLKIVKSGSKRKWWPDRKETHVCWQAFDASCVGASYTDHMKL